MTDHTCSYYCERPTCVLAQRDDIIRMALEADIDPHDMCEDPRIAENSLQRFATLVAAAEREACAKVAEKMLRFYTAAVTGVPEAIRARSKMGGEG